METFSKKYQSEFDQSDFTLVKNNPLLGMVRKLIGFFMLSKIKRLRAGI